MSTPITSNEKRCVVKHFKKNHSHFTQGRFIVPLPKNIEAYALGQSRSSAMKRFHSLERSLQAQGQFHELSKVVNEHFEKGHAEGAIESLVNDPLQRICR